MIIKVIIKYIVVLHQKEKSHLACSKINFFHHMVESFMSNRPTIKNYLEQYHINIICGNESIQIFYFFSSDKDKYKP